MSSTATTKTFIEGDRIQVLSLDYLKPRLRNASGTITAWCHDNLYEVAMDGGFNAVLEGSEMKSAPPRTDSALPTRVEHTATPWHVEAENLHVPCQIWHEGQQVAEMFGPTKLTRAANAAFVIEAVNFHDALVAEVGRLRKVISQMNHMGGDERGGYCICPLQDGSAPDARHASVCADARAALRSGGE